MIYVLFVLANEITTLNPPFIFPTVLFLSPLEQKFVIICIAIACAFVSFLFKGIKKINTGFISGYDEQREKGRAPYYASWVDRFNMFTNI